MKTLFLLCVMTFLFPAVASSGNEPAAGEVGEEEVFEPSKYASLSLAIGVDQFDDIERLEVGGRNYSEGLGVDVVLGTRWHPKFSLEAQFVYVEKIENDKVALEIRYEVFTANLKFYPVRGLVEPYLFAGVGAGRFEVRVPSERDASWGSVTRFGAGTEVNFSRTFALSLGGDYLVTLGNLDGLDVLEFKVGVISRFW